MNKRNRSRNILKGQRERQRERDRGRERNGGTEGEKSLHVSEEGLALTKGYKKANGTVPTVLGVSG